MNMKKSVALRFFVFVFCFMVICVTGIAACADEYLKGNYLIMKEIQVFSEPSEDSTVKTKLSPDYVVNVREVQNGWAHLDFGYAKVECLQRLPNNMVASVFKDYLEKRTEMYYVTSSKKIDVHDEANKSSKIVGKLERGQSVQVIRVANGWALIRWSYSGLGYVQIEFLSKDKVPKVNENVVNKIYYVIGGRLNVRTESSRLSKSVKLLNAGTQVKVISLLDNGWAKIEYDGQIRYVMTQFLSETAPKSSQTKVNTNGNDCGVYMVESFSGKKLNVRAEKSTSSKRLYQLDPGTSVQVICIENGWAKIKFKGKEAYVMAEFLVR